MSSPNHRISPVPGHGVSYTSSSSDGATSVSESVSHTSVSVAVIPVQDVSGENSGSGNEGEILAKEPYRPFDIIPEELFLLILQELSPSDLLVCAQVCQYWKQFAERDLLWRSLYLERWGEEDTYIVELANMEKASLALVEAQRRVGSVPCTLALPRYGSLFEASHSESELSYEAPGPDDASQPETPETPEVVIEFPEGLEGPIVPVTPMQAVLTNGSVSPHNSDDSSGPVFIPSRNKGKGRAAPIPACPSVDSSDMEFTCTHTDNLYSCTSPTGNGSSNSNSSNSSSSSSSSSRAHVAKEDTTPARKYQPITRDPSVPPRPPKISPGTETKSNTTAVTATTAATATATATATTGSATATSRANSKRRRSSSNRSPSPQDLTLFAETQEREAGSTQTPCAGPSTATHTVSRSLRLALQSEGVHNTAGSGGGGGGGGSKKFHRPPLTHPKHSQSLPLATYRYHHSLAPGGHKAQSVRPVSPSLHATDPTTPPIPNLVRRMSRPEDVFRRRKAVWASINGSGVDHFSEGSQSDLESSSGQLPHDVQAQEASNNLFASPQTTRPRAMPMPNISRRRPSQTITAGEGISQLSGNRMVPRMQTRRPLARAATTTPSYNREPTMPAPVTAAQMAQQHAMEARVLRLRRHFRRDRRKLPQHRLFAKQLRRLCSGSLKTQVKETVTWKGMYKERYIFDKNNPSRDQEGPGNDAALAQQYLDNNREKFYSNIFILNFYLLAFIWLALVGAKVDAIARGGNDVPEEDRPTVAQRSWTVVFIPLWAAILNLWGSVFYGNYTHRQNRVISYSALFCVFVNMQLEGVTVQLLVIGIIFGVLITVTVASLRIFVIKLRGRRQGDYPLGLPLYHLCYVLLVLGIAISATLLAVSFTQSEENRISWRFVFLPFEIAMLIPPYMCLSLFFWNRRLALLQRYAVISASLSIPLLVSARLLRGVLEGGVSRFIFAMVPIYMMWLVFVNRAFYMAFKSYRWMKEERLQDPPYGLMTLWRIHLFGRYVDARGEDIPEYN